MGGGENEPWNARQQIQKFRLKDGKHVEFTKATADKEHNHIQIYEHPKKLIPPGTPEADAAMMAAPLRAVAVHGDTIYVADALGNRVLRFHKETGEPQGEFAVKLPMALAIDASGRLWVGHEHHLVTAFLPDGHALAQVISNVGQIEALAFGPTGQLCVADSKAGQVKIFDVNGDLTKMEYKVLPGDDRPGARPEFDAETPRMVNYLGDKAQQ